MLEAGEGFADLTPPLGVEMAGFHRAAGQERRIAGIREASRARALALRVGESTVIVLVLDLLGISAEFARGAQQAVARATGVPAENVRVSCTHTHSMPTFRPFLQWGAVPREWMPLAEQRCVEAAQAAMHDLAPADVLLGKERAVGANFNRASKTWRTDAEFGRDSTDADRWLDTTVHALTFMREPPKRALLWYHFCAHPVCFGDDQAGPDWPGLVARKMRERDGFDPAFLQGHIGDVNPGEGPPAQGWIGDPEKTSEAVYAALHRAATHSEYIRADELRTVRSEVKLPFDLDRLRAWLERYRRTPDECASGDWVDAGFAKAWFDRAEKSDLKRDALTAPLTAVRLGELALLFHPAELYSFYGLQIRRDSPFPATLAIGYTDDFVGYVTDPKAYEAGEYAAMVVPKILELPPFRTDTARELAAAATALLRRLA